MAHFNSFVRIPLLVLREKFSPPLPPLPEIGTHEADVLQMRVWPGDIDFNLHMNNARFLTMMDYGRVHLLARGGLVKLVLQHRWTPLVGAVWITYRRSLPFWARFEMASRLVCWDERWFYMEQVFTGAKGVAAVGWVKGALHEPAGLVAPQRVMELIRPGIVSPEMPEPLQILNGLTRGKLKSAAGMVGAAR